MTSLFSLILTLLILSFGVDMMLGGKVGLTKGIMGLFSSLFTQIVQALFQIVLQITGSLIPAIVNLMGSTVGSVFKGIGWTLNQILKFLARGRKGVLILGPGENLKPGVGYRSLYDYSQTASKQEIAALAVGDPQKGDFWLGRYLGLQGSKTKTYSDLWLPNDFLHEHLLIVGATGSGKTELLLKSAGNLMRQGNLVLVDAAGFLGDRLFPAARSAGSKMICWDIGSKNNRVVWNFLEELEKFGAEQEIRAIAEALYGQYDDTDKNAAFWKRDTGWLTAILAIVVASRKEGLLAIKLEPSDLPTLVMDRDGIRALLGNLPQAAAQWEPDLISYLMLADDRFALDLSFLQNKLSPFKDPDVKAICDGQSGVYILPALNGNKKHTLVIGQNLADGKFATALAAVMISYVMNVMYRRMRNPNYKWNPTYIICDEAPRLENIKYGELTAIGRNAKASVVLMCQSIDQFQEKTLPALNNCRTQIFLQGVSLKTAEWLSKQLGEYERQEMTMTSTGVVGPSPWNQRQIGYKRVPVLGIRELTTRPDGKFPKRNAAIRVTNSRSPMTKTFLTDYSTT
jgi:energy-coupling factor transporter ATP-binding protein EcfA2